MSWKFGDPVGPEYLATLDHPGWMDECLCRLCPGHGPVSMSSAPFCWACVHVMRCHERPGVLG